MLGAAIAFAAPPPKPTSAPVTADPNDPEKTRTIVPREEREKLGLTPHTWSGVVHPDVYLTLDKLKKTEARLRERLRNESGEQGEEVFDMLWFMHFKGTVYVQVQLKSKDAQRRVLASLKTSEFHAQQLFAAMPAWSATRLKRRWTSWPRPPM